MQKTLYPRGAKVKLTVTLPSGETVVITDEDLAACAARIQNAAAGWQDVFIYFKHEEAGIGPKRAAQMMELLA